MEQDQQQQQTHVSIDDGIPFFAHEASINFTPTQFTVDFRCVTPRTDPRGKGKPAFQIRHNVVMFDPWHFKLLCDIMGPVLKKYEDEFGKVKKPASLTKAEGKKVSKEVTVPSEKRPAYFG